MVLIRAFQSAKWGTAQLSDVTCYKCFDGEDVRLILPKAAPPHYHDWARYFTCQCCGITFSDLRGTPLERMQQPLTHFALIALDQGRTAPFHFRSLLPDIPSDAIARINKRLDGHPFTDLWRQRMMQAGLTPQAILSIWNRAHLYGVDQ